MLRQITLTIDGVVVETVGDATILEAARSAGIYIPTLCHHPDLPPAADNPAAPLVYQGDVSIENAKPEKGGAGCGLCVISVIGETALVEACSATVREGMVVVTGSDRIKAERREKLMRILACHRHACLTCAQQEGCSRSHCSANVPEGERCCSQFGHCELQQVANHIGIPMDTPKWLPTHLPLLDKDPLFIRDYNLCVGCIRCVRVCRDLRGVGALGFVHGEDGRIHIGTTASTLIGSGCKFCTACVSVCPTGAIVDKDIGPGEKAADIVSCAAACPAGIDVPGYLRLIASGKPGDAAAVIREKVPFPGVLGRVCHHPCEDACRRGALDAPVSICALKRYAADNDDGEWPVRRKNVPPTGRRIAVVGAGPAGLAAGFYLRKKGHTVTLFEAEEKAGGMMRYGIPPYRLPRSILDHEIDAVLNCGIQFRPCQRLGEAFTLAQLRTEGYDAVFIATGAQLSHRISLEGGDLPDVLWGIEFLRQVCGQQAVALKENVVVIGGGNVAVDVALTALRCGAEKVYMACLECEGQIPANPWEIEAAVAAGVTLLPARGPSRIISENGWVTGLEIIACTGVFDEKGNFCPRFDAANTECLPVDQVILAVGQASDLSFLEEKDPIQRRNGWIVVDKDTLETGMPGVYAGGDVVGVKGSVIHAVAAGRSAAAAIDLALGGNGDIDESGYARSAPDHHLGREEGFAGWSRQAVPKTDISRPEDFSELVLGYEYTQAVQEAKRCLQCDLRLKLRRNPTPPVDRLPFTDAAIRSVPSSEGVFRLLDESLGVLTIKGTSNLRRDLLNHLASGGRGVFFTFEEEKMYSRRESELIQQYLQAHGEMPGGGDDDLDDLF